MKNKFNKKCTRCKQDFLGDNKHCRCNSCRSEEYKEKHNLRKCRGCKNIKERNKFEKQNRYCIECHYLRDENKKLSLIASNKKYKLNNPDKAKNWNTITYKRKYYSYDTKTIIRYRLRSCKQRAMKNSLDFELDENFLLNMYDEQNGKCAVTKIEFDATFNEKFTRRPFALSIDRIDSNLGYLKTNVRLVCNVVNAALNEY